MKKKQIKRYIVFRSYTCNITTSNDSIRNVFIFLQKRGKGDTDGSIDHTHLLLLLRPTSSHCFLPTPPPPISSNLFDSICAWMHLDYEGVSSLPKSIQVNICRTLMAEFAPSLIRGWSPLPFRKKIFFRYICVTFCV